MDYSPLAGAPDAIPVEIQPNGRELKTWHRSTVVAPQALAAPHPPTSRFHSTHKKRLQGPGRQVIDREQTNLQVLPVDATTVSTKKSETRNELPLLLRQTRAAARRRQREAPQVLADELKDQLDIPAPDTNKQMWKRGGELPALALAQIRDRVGYKRKSSNLKRRSIVAEFAPAIANAESDDGSSADVHPETIFPLDENQPEEDEVSDDDVSAEAQSDSDEKQVAEDPARDRVDSSSDGDTARRKRSQELSEEFQRLHIASRERELTRRRSLLAQLQTEEDAAVEESLRRHSKDATDQHERPRRRPSRRPSVRPGTTSTPSSAEISPSRTSSPLFGSSDDDSGPPRRRRLRVKTRAATADPYAEFSEEEDDADSLEDVQRPLGMTQAERDAAFQALLTQYLGLLQCSPAEVARQLHVRSP